MCEHILYFAVFVHISLHLPAMSIIKFNGLNCPEWCEQVQFHLIVLDLDLALLSEKPIALIDSSSIEQRSSYNA